jgi:hypothetical protein
LPSLETRREIFFASLISALSVEGLGRRSSAPCPDPPRLDPAPREDYTPGTFRVGDVPIEPEREAVT